MRKVIATLLLSIHLFNLGGYHVLYQYFIYQSDKVMNEHISKNMYNVHELVEVKVPVHLPNISSWSSYQQIRGQIQFREGCYNYVKLKITRDTLFVMCIPNYEKTRLVSSNIIYAKYLADLPASKHDNLPSIKKIGLDIYHLEASGVQLLSRVVYVNTYKTEITVRSKAGIEETPYLPPESC